MRNWIISLMPRARAATERAARSLQRYLAIAMQLLRPWPTRTQQHAAVTQARARAEASAHRWPSSSDVRVLEGEVLMVNVTQEVVQLRMRKHEGSQRRAR